MNGNHEWSTEAFYNKAIVYFDKMEKCDRSEFDYGLWALLALENVLKASLSNISPILLADFNSEDNVFYSLELPITSSKFKPKTAEINLIIKRLGNTIEGFNKDYVDMAKHLTGLRNMELHSSIRVFPSEDSKGWEAKYFKLIEILLESLEESFDDLFESDYVDYIETLIKSYDDKQAKGVKSLINSCKTLWNELLTEEKEEKKLTAEKEALSSRGHIVDCPSCGCKAVLKGDSISEARLEIEDTNVTEKHHILPTSLECFACKLKILGHSRLYNINLGDSFTSTEYYSVGDYYSEEVRTEYNPYEDFFND